MRKSHSNSSDILKAAHKLDQYLMKGESSSGGSSNKGNNKRSLTGANRDADDIEDPLSMPRSEIASSNNSTQESDDDVQVITTTTRKQAGDPISKFNLKRKTQLTSSSSSSSSSSSPSTSSSNTSTKKPKHETIKDKDEIDSLDTITATSTTTATNNKYSPTPSPTPSSSSKGGGVAPRQPKRVSAASILDDDDDDVLNFSVIADICKTDSKPTASKTPSKSSSATSKSPISSTSTSKSPNSSTTSKSPTPSPSSSKSPTPSSTSKSSNTTSSFKKSTSHSKSQPKETIDLDDDDDFIESDNEKKSPKKRAKGKSNNNIDIISLIKGMPPSAKSNNNTSPNSSFTQGGSHATVADKFVKPKAPVDVATFIPANPTAELWVEKYEPTVATELAMHSKKISEVRQWIRNSLDALQAGVKNSQRMLVLTGPCGAGKTALLRVLAKEVACEVCEWVTPPMPTKKGIDDALMLPYMPRLQEFQKWLRFASLSQGLFASVHKIILVEDLPFLSDVAKTDEFRETIREFLRNTKYPLVFIISDTYMGNSAINTILSHDILESYYVQQIGVNPVAVTFAKKAVMRIVKAENLDIDATLAERLFEENEGDIRAIINSLQFFCVGQARKGAQKKGRGKSKTKDQDADKGKEKGNGNVGFLGSRDISLSLFHALGKILYNKRLLETNPNVNMDSPTYRPPMENVPEEVVGRIHIEPSMFNMFLHQNYCDFFTEIDDMANAMYYLSDSDRLAKNWEDSLTFGPFITSIAARGFQYSQVHEFPHTFLPLKKPQYIETMKTREVNSTSAVGLVKNEIYAYHSKQPDPEDPDEDRPCMCIAPSTVLLTEILPFMHTILSNSNVRPFRDSAVMSKFTPTSKVNNYNNPPNTYNNSNNNNNNNRFSNSNFSNSNFSNSNFSNSNFSNSNFSNNYNNKYNTNYANNSNSNSNNRYNSNSNNSTNNYNNSNPSNTGNFYNKYSNNNTTNNSNSNPNNNKQQASQYYEPFIILPTTQEEYDTFLSGPSFNLLNSLCTYSTTPQQNFDRTNQLEKWFIPDDEQDGLLQEQERVVELADDIED